MAFTSKGVTSWYVRVFAHTLTVTMTIINITSLVGDPYYYNLPLLTIAGRGSIPSYIDTVSIYIFLFISNIHICIINVFLFLLFATKCMYVFPSSNFLTHKQGLKQKKQKPLTSKDLLSKDVDLPGIPRPRLLGCLV